MPSLKVKVRHIITVQSVDMVRLREELRYSQADFAAVLGWSQQNLSRVEEAHTEHELGSAQRQALLDLGVNFFEVTILP